MIINERLFSKIQKVMPISCVDLLVTDAVRRVLLLKRRNSPAAGQWWFPGGRVHFMESRASAAIRKLEEECGLEADDLNEIGTYDVMLPVDGEGSTLHGITTVFHVRVGRAEVRLEHQSSASDWRTPEEWSQQPLHPFVKQHVSALEGNSACGIKPIRKAL